VEARVPVVVVKRVEVRTTVGLVGTGRTEASVGQSAFFTALVYFIAGLIRITVEHIVDLAVSLPPRPDPSEKGIRA